MPTAKNAAQKQHKNTIRATGTGFADREGGTIAMIDGIFNQPNYVAAKRMLDAVAVRQQAIASNIANVETPGYKRLDIEPSFAQALQRAAAGRDVSQLNGLRPSVSVDSKAVSSRRDGNTVTLENELIQLNHNYLDHLLDQQLVSGSLLKLRMAITGKAT